MRKIKIFFKISHLFATTDFYISKLDSLPYLNIFTEVKTSIPVYKTEEWNIKGKNLLENYEFYEKILNKYINSPHLFSIEQIIDLKNLIFTSIRESNSKKEISHLFITRACIQISRVSLLLKIDIFYILKFLNSMLDTIKNEKYMISLSEITQIILIYQDIYKNNDNFSENDMKLFNESIKTLTIFLRLCLQERSKSNNNTYNLFLLQILYCLIRFDYDDKLLYIKMLDRLLNIDLPKNLLEIQMTSFILSLVRLSRKYPDFLTNLNNFYKYLENKIYQRIKEDSLLINRLPHILYCYAAMNMYPNITKIDIIEKIKKFSHNFDIFESLIIIHSISKLIDLDPEFDLFCILCKNILKKQFEFKSIINKDLFTLLISLRKPFSVLKENQEEKLSFFKEFRAVILNNLDIRFDTMKPKTKLIFLYEIAIIEKSLTHQMFRKSKYEQFILNHTDLVQFSNYDFITIGFIINKYCYPNTNYFNFIINYLDNLEKRTFIKEIETKRINDILSNLLKFMEKNLKTGKSNYPNIIINKIKNIK